MENKDLQSLELTDDLLEQASGGAYTECNRGYTCPLCSSDKIRIFDNTSPPAYYCFDCKRSGPLNP